MAARRIDNKGQTGFFGEDLIYIITILLAVALVLVITVKEFSDYESRMARVNVFRAGLIGADVAASKLAWDFDGEAAPQIRVIDSTQLAKQSKDCKSLCSYCSTIRVLELEDNDNEKELFSCGSEKNDPDIAKSVVRLPVSIRILESGSQVPFFAPGILEVSIAR